MALICPVVALHEYFWLIELIVMQVSSGIAVTDVGKPGAAQVVPGAKLRWMRLLVLYISKGKSSVVVTQLTLKKGAEPLRQPP